MQFSPTSEHILLAYGRRHGSLLKSIVIDGETTMPIYTVLEVKAFSLHVLTFEVSFLS
jgi:activator-of-BECN1-regulated-autophagy protein 1